MANEIEITFKNGRRVWTDADITPKVLTELQTQFESEVTEVNRKPLSKHSVLKAKAGTKTSSKPKKSNPNAISWETFEEKYNPQINHILKEKYPKDDPTGLTGWGGIMYETYGDEYEYIREMAQKHPNRVWTLVDGDDGELVIIAGWHYVNRMNYVITEKPWNTGDEYVDDEMAKHGAKINYIKKWSVSYIDIYKKKQRIVIDLGRMSNKDDVNYALKRRGDVYEVLSITEVAQNGTKTNFSRENAEMVLNNNKQIKHHTNEIADIITADTHVPAWVVAKVNRSASDLSDATHYLDGAKGKEYKGGGVIFNEIKNEKEKMTSELFKKYGVFFAFSDKQFHENKTPLKPGEKYVSIGVGGYLPKGKLDAFLDGMEAINKFGKTKVKENNLAETEILYELKNHECFYTGEIDDVVNMFKGTYTDKQIRDVYNKHRKANQD